MACNNRKKIIVSHRVSLSKEKGNMYSRRHLRVKVLQSLYAYRQSDSSRPDMGEKYLMKNINLLHETYFYILKLAIDVCDYFDVYSDNQKLKYLIENQINVDLKLNSNKTVLGLKSSADLKRAIKGIPFANEENPDLVKKLFTEFYASNEYKTYLAETTSSLDIDSEIIWFLARKVILNNEEVDSFLEEHSIGWATDKELVEAGVRRTLKSITADNRIQLMPLSKDWANDKEYVELLFSKVLEQDEELDKMIESKTKNWDMERIALTDMLIIKLALVEMQHFSNIPLKVTINEYIEIAKQFSTPKSKQFVNGVLDNLMKELKEKGQLVKFGRGLVDKQIVHKSLIV